MSMKRNYRFRDGLTGRWIKTAVAALKRAAEVTRVRILRRKPRP